MARPVDAAQSSAAVVVEIVGAGTGAEVPVRPRLTGDGEPDVREGAADLTDHVMGAVLVAGDQHPGHPVVGDGATVAVGLAEHRVQPLEHALGDRRRAAQPCRRGDDQDLGR